MKVKVNGKPNFNNLARALNEVFDSMTQEELDYLKQKYNEKLEQQNKEQLKQAG